MSQKTRCSNTKHCHVNTATITIIIAIVGKDNDDDDDDDIVVVVCLCVVGAKKGQNLSIYLINWDSCGSRNHLPACANACLRVGRLLLW